MGWRTKTNINPTFIFMPYVECVALCIGRVLNRFSKDVGFLDDRLIISFIDFLSVRVYIQLPCTSLCHLLL